MKIREYTLPDGRKYRQPIPKSFVENYQINDESKPIYGDDLSRPILDDEGNVVKYEQGIVGYEKKTLCVADHPLQKGFEEYPYEVIDEEETPKSENVVIEKQTEKVSYKNLQEDGSVKKEVEASLEIKPIVPETKTIKKKSKKQNHEVTK